MITTMTTPMIAMMIITAANRRRFWVDEGPEGAPSIVTVAVEVSVVSALSVTVSVTVYSPAVVYE